MKMKLRMMVATMLFAMLIVACDKKDEVDCGALEKKFTDEVTAVEDLYDTVPEIDDTDGLDEAECTAFAEWLGGLLAESKDLIALLKQSKSCAFAKEFIVDSGYGEDEFDLLISELESELENLEVELADLCN